jgi:hypothetical protein
MSANAKPQNSANAKSPPEAPSSVSGFSAGNAIGSMLIIGLGIASIVLFIRSTISTSDLIGNTENWRAIKPQIKRIWWQTAVGATILFIGMFAYVLQYEKASVVFILLISCSALALSFAAVSMSAISTSGASPTA